MTYNIEKVATLIGARRYGKSDASVCFLLTDSRSLCFPEETLFFAIRTSSGDGHNYIPDLYRRGVRSFVVEHVPDGYATDYPGANFLKVVGSLEALQRLAERHRDEYDIPIVGITGSNGKTVVKEWLHQLLSPEMNVVRSPRSYNSQTGVPLSVWLLGERADVGLFEAGISQPGEMAALRDVIQPTIGVLTNLGDAHQENFTSREAKCKEKLTLFHDAQTVVYCMDDEVVRCCMSEFAYKGEQMSWSMKNPNAPFYVSQVEQHGASVTVHYAYHHGRKGEEAVNIVGEYTLPLIDDGSIRNSITAAVVALCLGVKADDLAKRMSGLEPVAMRLEVKDGQNGCLLINDSYNSDINSLDIALDFMNRRADHEDRRHTLILSDIYQSGMSIDELYAQVSYMSVKRGVKKFIGIGADLCSQAETIKVGEKFFFATVDEFVHSAVFQSLRDEVILLKGARKFGFDRLTELLVQKVHETTLEVSLGAVVKNLNHYRSMMKPTTKMVCMIKADGYGAGRGSGR